MVRHVIIWTLNDDFTEQEKTNALIKSKRGLERLRGRIDGLERIRVYIDNLDSSNADMMLDATFTDEASLATYQKNPDHLAVAEFIRSVVKDRKCIDYIV